VVGGAIVPSRLVSSAGGGGVVVGAGGVDVVGGGAVVGVVVGALGTGTGTGIVVGSFDAAATSPPLAVFAVAASSPFAAPPETSGSDRRPAELQDTVISASAPRHAAANRRRADRLPSLLA
jgi:hypothetical protein